MTLSQLLTLHVLLLVTPRHLSCHQSNRWGDKGKKVNQFRSFFLFAVLCPSAWWALAASKKHFSVVRSCPWPSVWFNFHRHPFSCPPDIFQLQSSCPNKFKSLPQHCPLHMKMHRSPNYACKSRSKRKKSFLLTEWLFWLLWLLLNSTARHVGTFVWERFSNSLHSLQSPNGLPFGRKAKGRKFMHYWSIWLAQTDAVGHNITT